MICLSCLISWLVFMYYDEIIGFFTINQGKMTWLLYLMLSFMENCANINKTAFWEISTKGKNEMEMNL